MSNTPDRGGPAQRQTPWESILPEARTTKRRVVLPRRTRRNPGSKVGEGKGLALQTSVVLPAGQRNQIHRASGSLSSLFIIKELVNQSK